MPFDKRCDVYRTTETLDEYKTPTGESFPKIGNYACSVSRKAATVSKEDPNIVTVETLKLYSYARADIQEGDIVEVDGAKYTAGMPYRPRNHHLEVELMKESDG
jgi:hypothetical protein